VDPETQEVEQALRDDRTGAREAEGEGVGPQHEHRPDDLPRKGLAHARGVADEEVLLEPLRVRTVDRPVGERADPRRHPVHDRALVDECLDDGARPLHAGTCRRVQDRLGAAPGDRLHVGEGEIAPGQNDALEGHGTRIVG
jgi:hypothetical protein